MIFLQMQSEAAPLETTNHSSPLPIKMSDKSGDLRAYIDVKCSFVLESAGAIYRFMKR
jgi:hypothetical protein